MLYPDEPVMSRPRRSPVRRSRTRPWPSSNPWSRTGPGLASARHSRPACALPDLLASSLHPRRSPRWPRGARRLPGDHAGAGHPGRMPPALASPSRWPGWRTPADAARPPRRAADLHRARPRTASPDNFFMLLAVPRHRRDRIHRVEVTAGPAAAGLTSRIPVADDHLTAAWAPCPAWLQAVGTLTCGPRSPNSPTTSDHLPRRRSSSSTSPGPLRVPGRPRHRPQHQRPPRLPHPKAPACPLDPSSGHHAELNTIRPTKPIGYHTTPRTTR